MVIVTVDQISRLWPGIQICVASYAKTERYRFGRCNLSGSQGPVEFEFIRNSRRPLRVIRALVARLAPSSFRRIVVKGDPYLAEFEKVDLVVDISGFALSDQRSAIRRLAYATESLTAWALRKPMFLLTQAFGPMSAPLTRAIAGWVLPRAELVVARDQESTGHILGLKNGHEVALYQCTDMAMLLPGSEGPRWGDGSRPVLGIVPNVNLTTHEERQGVAGAYVRQLIAVAQLGIELGAEVVMVCYETFPDRPIDDTWVARAVISRVSPSKVHLVDTAGATELKGIIASLDFLVGARYHSVVAAAASATPFLAVGWAHKYSELATEAGVPYAYIDGRTSSIENVLSAVRVGWDRRDETRTLLDLGRSSLEASARRAFEVMFETWNATDRPD